MLLCGWLMCGTGVVSCQLSGSVVWSVVCVVSCQFCAQMELKTFRTSRNLWIKLKPQSFPPGKTSSLYTFKFLVELITADFFIFFDKWKKYPEIVAHALQGT